ncbi:unnamed protein product, partial [Coregonus sp. 'balchen']
MRTLAGVCPDYMDFVSVLSMVGLLLIALGTGGIKPCVAAFGGDQFLDHQWAEFVLFASLLVAVCVIFSIMAYFYTYMDPAEIEAQFRDKG